MTFDIAAGRVSYVGGTVLAAFVTLLSLTSGCLAENSLVAEDLVNAEKLIAYRKAAPAKDRALADEMYQHALAAAKKDSAAAVKAFSESVLLYPSSKALLGLAEHRAKMLTNKDAKVKTDELPRIAQLLNAANKVDAVARSVHGLCRIWPV